MASQSVVDICNLALDAIGTRSTISSLSEQSKEAKACARHYAQAVSSILQAARWNFARKQAPLSLLKDATLNPPQTVPVPWVYEYAYPSDCVQGRFILPQWWVGPSGVPGAVAAPQSNAPPVRWLVGLDQDASSNNIKVILTNQPNAVLVYTAQINDTGLYDDQFVEALYNYLGWRICATLSGDKTLAKMAFQVAKDKTDAACASNGNEGITVIDNIPDWIRVRGYASDWAYPPGSFYSIEPQALTMIL